MPSMRVPRRRRRRRLYDGVGVTTIIIIIYMYISFFYFIYLNVAERINMLRSSATPSKKLCIVTLSGVYGRRIRATLQIGQKYYATTFKFMLNMRV